MLALGGSFVFWFILLGKIISGVIISYMYALVIACALLPAAAALIFWKLGRRESINQWLFCTVASGIVCAIVTFIIKLIFDGAPDWALLLPLICCAIAGCAIPSGVALLSRIAIRKIIIKKRNEIKPTWTSQKKDILDMTDFDTNKQ